MRVGNYIQASNIYSYDHAIDYAAWNVLDCDLILLHNFRFLFQYSFLFLEETFGGQLGGKDQINQRACCIRELDVGIT